MIQWAPLMLPAQHVVHKSDRLPYQQPPAQRVDWILPPPAEKDRAAKCTQRCEQRGETGCQAPGLENPISGDSAQSKEMEPYEWKPN